MITLYEPDGLTPLPEAVDNLTEVTPARSREFLLKNTDPSRPVVSLKLWLEQEDGPATRAVSVQGVGVTGTTRETATEVLGAPLAPGATLGGSETWSAPPGHDFSQSVPDGATLRWLALPG